MVDCKDASFTKLIKNGSPSLKTVLDVSATSKGNLVFSDVEARRIAGFDSGAANYMVGSGIDSSKDGWEKRLLLSNQLASVQERHIFDRHRCSCPENRITH